MKCLSGNCNKESTQTHSFGFRLCDEHSKKYIELDKRVKVKNHKHIKEMMDRLFK